jgi:large-conductance mechanosensitive channel
VYVVVSNILTRIDRHISKEFSIFIYKMKIKSFSHWLFVKRDVDSLIIAFIISTACNDFIKDFSLGIIKPIIEGILPKTDKSSVQTLNIYDYLVIRFQLQYVVSGFFKLSVNFALAYVIVMHVYRLLDVN